MVEAQMREEDVYELGRAITSAPHSIEILPGDLDIWTSPSNYDGPDIAATPFLLVEGNLGIPQKALYKLYVLAIAMFKSLRGMKEVLITQELNQVTAVIILANPAHQTAINHRKRLVCEGVLPAQDELAFAGLLQANRSHAKESVLWSHRAWLLRHLYYRHGAGVDAVTAPEPPADQMSLPLAALRLEFAIIFRAAEIYPRNYYAWNHWRFCIDVLFACLLGPHSEDYAQLVIEQYQQLSRWIEQHVSDYSAAHHLAGLVSLIGKAASTDGLISYINPRVAFDRVMSLSSFFSAHESLRLYARTLIGLEVDKLQRERMGIRLREITGTGGR